MPLPILLYLLCIYFVLLVYFCIYFLFFLYLFCTLILADFRIVFFPDFFFTFSETANRIYFVLFSYFNLFRKIGSGGGHPFLNPSAIQILDSLPTRVPDPRPSWILDQASPGSQTNPVLDSGPTRTWIPDQLGPRSRINVDQDPGPIKTWTHISDPPSSDP